VLCWHAALSATASPILCVWINSGANVSSSFFESLPMFLAERKPPDLMPKILEQFSQNTSSSSSHFYFNFFEG